jgi:ATP-dependent Zn protease
MHLDKIAKALLEKEVLEKEEFDALFSGSNAVQPNTYTA